MENDTYVWIEQDMVDVSTLDNPGIHRVPGLMSIKGAEEIAYEDLKRLEEHAQKMFRSGALSKEEAIQQLNDIYREMRDLKSAGQRLNEQYPPNTETEEEDAEPITLDLSKRKS